MKIHYMEQRTPEWQDMRLGKMTGTALKDILGTPSKREKTFYEMVAERLQIPEYDDENPMVRGARLEDEAMRKYMEITGYEVEKVGFIHRDDNKFIGYSPDGIIKIEDKYRGNLEMKCLGSTNHVIAWLKNEIPEEYMPQVIQAFIVNDDLEWNDFFMYDPRIVAKPYLLFRVEREDVKELIKEYRAKQEAFLKEVDEQVSQLVPF